MLGPLPSYSPGSGLALVRRLQRDRAGFLPSSGSHTIYTITDPGLDVARHVAAEAAVQGSRAENRLGLPRLPAEQIAALARTLDYPPKGSARHE